MLASRHLSSQFILRPSCVTGLISKASICHKSKLPEKNVRHWPYEKVPWNYFTMIGDPRTKKKFDENTKVIQIEGNIACGKKDFAQRLANELNMKIIPMPDLEGYYVNDHGYDYCALNPLLPERLRLCNWEMFHEDPTRHSVVHQQYYLFKLYLYQYVKALQHLFNTGQGVILIKSAYTHRSFIEAMHELGWLPMGYLRGDGFRFYDWKYYYLNMRNKILQGLQKPHLTIYLDTPVDKCMERIKNSKNPMIANSKAFVPEYLEAIERAYNDVVLPRQDYHSHVLRVEAPDRLTDDELGDVIDDIEKLDFTYDHHHTRFESWSDRDFNWYYKTRRCVTSNKIFRVFEAIEVPDYDIAGLGDSISQVDLILRQSLYEANVDDFGQSIKKSNDLRFTKLVNVILPTFNYGDKLNERLRTDFL